MVLMIVFSPISLIIPMVSPLYLLAFPSPEYYLVEPIDNPMVFDANVYLSYEDNEFDVLSGNVDDYVSISYFRVYDPSTAFIMYA